MTETNARREAIRSISETPAAPPSVDLNRPVVEIFGENVFSMAVMRETLPKKVFQSLLRTIEHGEKLDPVHADSIANAMKD